MGVAGVMCAASVSVRKMCAASGTRARVRVCGYSGLR